jgi:fatty acid desaturase
VDVSPFVQSGAGWRPQSESARGSEYAMLSRRVRRAGLLDRRLRYYAWKITFTALALAAGWAAFAVLGDSWWQLGTAVFLAAVFTQVGFLGHDAGHRQVFRSRRANYVLGVLCGNLGTGLSYGWWTGKHNRHHAHPNTEGADPDIMIGVLAFSGGRARASRGIQRLVFRCQAYLLVPMLFLEAISLHAASIRALTRRACRNRAWEAALLGVHAAGYLTAVFLVLPPVKPWPSSSCSRACSGSTWGARSRPTTRGCRFWPRPTRPASCAARCSPRATSAAAGSPTSPWAA